MFYALQHKETKRLMASIPTTYDEFGELRYELTEKLPSDNAWLTEYYIDAVSVLEGRASHSNVGTPKNIHFMGDVRIVELTIK